MVRLRAPLVAAAVLAAAALPAAPAEAGHRTGSWRNLPNGPSAGDTAAWRPHDERGPRREGRLQDGAGERLVRTEPGARPTMQVGGPARWNLRALQLAPGPASGDDWN